MRRLSPRVVTWATLQASILMALAFQPRHPRRQFPPQGRLIVRIHAGPPSTPFRDAATTPRWFQRRGPTAAPHAPPFAYQENPCRFGNIAASPVHPPATPPLSSPRTPSSSS